MIAACVSLVVSQAGSLIIAETLLVSLQSPVHKCAARLCTLSTW